jgi:hypothetical protein
MKRTRTGLPAVALLGATLLLAGCGSDTGTKDETVAGADGGNEQEPEKTPEDKAPEDDGIDRPDIELPDNVQNIFEDWTSDDPKEQAVLRDGQERQDGMALAVLEQAPEAEYVLFYNSGRALETSQQWIDGFIENGVTISGSVRFLKPEVFFREDGKAVLNYCTDESEAVSLYIDTGEELKGSDQSEVAYSTVLEQKDQGVWVTTIVHTERKACVS